MKYMFENGGFPDEQRLKFTYDIFKRTPNPTNRQRTPLLAPPPSSLAHLPPDRPKPHKGFPPNSPQKARLPATNPASGDTP